MKLRTIKRLRLSGLLAASVSAAALVAGCSAGRAEEEIPSDGDLSGASTSAITNVDHSAVERQSIGNCWLYATASWAESLYLSATGEEIDTSQSYTTYWHWFEQLANGSLRDNEISTGGSYNVAVDIYTRYGLMRDADFVVEEATDEMSDRQKEALATINESLKSGVLSDPEKRNSRFWIRRELDRAWKLTPDVRTMLNRVFGYSVTRTLDKSYVDRKPPSRDRIFRTKDFPARLKNPETGNWDDVSLAEAIGEKDGFGYWATYSGKYAWNETSYPRTSDDRREFQKRIQRALHDHQPVIISWWVDFNALGRDGTFSLETLESNGGAGHAGGHMVVMHDYEAENVPGFGLLQAGVDETRPEALEAALSDATTIKFWRIKNSWGSYRPDRWDTAPIPGYHDLYQTYLDGPIDKCQEDDDGKPIPGTCYDKVPFQDAVFPAGY